LVGQVFSIILSHFINNTCRIRLTNIYKILVGFFFNKFVKNFTHICKKILQVCVKLWKSYLVGLVPDHDSTVLSYESEMNESLKFEKKDCVR
jgi:hypothetical protein